MRKTRENHADHLPPGASARLRGLVLLFSRPVARFLHVEAASGVVLLAAAGLAVLWANSPWATSYVDLLHAPISIGFGDHSLSKTVHYWINDILMVLFFFVVGLEVRRELHEGVLSDSRRAAIPVAAALGGMLVPALLYVWVDPNLPVGRDGWSVPMATDIAFAVGVLALLGNRVSGAMRILLLSIAIIDDIGAIVVIALFHTADLALEGLAISGAGVALVLIMQGIGVRNPLLYVVPGVIVWAGIVSTGVHPTVAGVILGLLTPVKPWFGRETFLAAAEQALSDFRAKDRHARAAHEIRPVLDRINLAQREVIAPVTRVEMALHPWVAFAVMPLFAFANAGVPLGGVDLAAHGATEVALGICLGLVIGKPLGIVVFTWLAVRWTGGGLPQGVSWPGVVVLGCLAGIGFTMSLFLGSLAFDDPGILAVAKMAVLVASLIAGVAGLVLGFTRLPRKYGGGPEPSEECAHMETTTFPSVAEGRVVTT